MSIQNKIVIIVLVLLSVGLVWMVFDEIDTDSNDTEINSTSSIEYDPQLEASDLTTEITNELFTLPKGREIVFEAETEDGVERVEITIEEEPKMIGDIETIVYRDREYLDGELVEDTRDYLAQNTDTGDVWYFGEDVENYEDGKLISREGSFMHGVDGAKAGIWIKGSHVVGDSYKQEYYIGEAEDMRDVVAIDQTVEIGLGTYTDCVKFYDWTPLEADAREHKYYCPESASLVLIEDLAEGVRTELVKITEL